MAEKVVITVPEGAVPGATISFSLPKTRPSPAVGASPVPGSKSLPEDRAAVMIQARVRGKSTRANMTKLRLDRKAVVAVPTATTDGVTKDESTEYEATEEIPVLAPALVPDTGSSRALLPLSNDDDASEALPVTPAAGWTLGGMMKRSLGNVLSVFGGQQPLPAVPAEAAIAAELTRIGSLAIRAWEQADFDAFAALALPSIAISQPGFTDTSMQGVWQARHEEGQLDGILSIDTVMVQVDDEERATLVALEHCHDTETSGMVSKHLWVRMQFVRPISGTDASTATDDVEGASTTTWKLEEIVFDPIWPKSEEEDAAPDEFRLGKGRTLRLCSDVTSLCSVLFTAWLAGDRSRFEAVADPALAVSIRALGIMAKSASEAYEARSKLLAFGDLISINSPMVDSESEPDKTRVLAHAHLYSVTDDASFGQPTVHFALGITFDTSGGEPVVTQIVSDVIWMGEHEAPETEGLSFESSPLQSIYTRALTFIKAWETNAVEGITSLTTDTVALEVPRFAKNETGQEALLAYRDTLGTPTGGALGMLTVDSVRVAPTRFTAYLHEYGIEQGQHGLPLMHAEIILDFDPVRDGSSVLIKRLFLDIEYVQRNRRSSVLASAPPEEQLTLAAEL